MADVEVLKTEQADLNVAMAEGRNYQDILRQWIRFSEGRSRVDPTAQQDIDLRALAAAAKTQFKVDVGAF